MKFNIWGKLRVFAILQIIVWSMLAFDGADQDVKAAPEVVEQCCERIQLPFCCYALLLELWWDNGGHWPGEYGQEHGGDADEVLGTHFDGDGTPYEEIE